MTGFTPLRRLLACAGDYIDIVKKKKTGKLEGTKSSDGDCVLVCRTHSGWQEVGVQSLEGHERGAVSLLHGSTARHRPGGARQAFRNPPQAVGALHQSEKHLLGPGHDQPSGVCEQHAPRGENFDYIFLSSIAVDLLSSIAVHLSRTMELFADVLHVSA